MLKWILGIVAFLFLAVLGTCWYGYNKLTAGGDTAFVMVATSPERAWSHISDADSIQSWADSASVMRVSRQGPLEVGDTLSIDGPNPGGGDVNSSRRMTMIVEEIHAPITLTWVARDTSGQGTVSRVDSVIQLGDSVRISSTFAVALADSLARADTSSSIAGRLVKGTFQVVVGALRMATQGDLDRLKARLEGR